MTNNVDSPLAVLKSVIPSLAGVRILDVGCGSGGLARLLAEEGAEVTGIDPNPQALTAARMLAPAARFEEASAEALPFEDAAFDVVLVVNALIMCRSTRWIGRWPRLRAWPARAVG